MQVVWYVVGVVAIIVIMQFDSEQLWKLTTWGYILGLLMLLAVLFFYDRATFADTEGRRVGSDLGPSHSSLRSGENLLYFDFSQSRDFA